MPIGVQSAELTFAPQPTGNGIRVVTTKGTYEITESQIPNNMKNKIDDAEAWANNWLDQNMTHPPYIAVHVFTLVPFNVQLYTGDTPPVGNWWE